MQQAYNSNPKFVSSQKYKVGVLLGGSSSERAISRRSGRAVNRALRKVGYSTLLIDPAVKEHLKKRLPQIDVAFIALHGEGGEDGQIQKFLSKKRIPFTGSPSLASQRAFNKEKAKFLFKKSRIPTPDYTVIQTSNWESRIRDFRLPGFLKPPCQGSSVGVFEISDFKQSRAKIKASLSRYKRLILERKIEGRELTVGVLGDRALPVVEVVPKCAFYDFRAKYTAGMTRYIAPAKISRKLAAKLQKLALRAHRVLGLRDFSRVDIMVDHRGRAFVLEVNSIPGFTELSLLPKAAKVAGIGFESMCDQLVQWALIRSKRK